ncbi:hypothetical protein PENTCL1PPCAC_14595, partial [Pristionchus entomophagus]
TQDLPSSSFEDLSALLLTVLPSSSSLTTSEPVSSSTMCLLDEHMRMFADPIPSVIWRFIFPVQFTLGVLGNVLNLWVLTSDDVPNNIANDLLAAVSLCDLAFLLGMAPNSLAAFDYFILSPRYRLFYLQTRLHFSGFANWMSAAAIWLILAVSIERLLVVRNPLRSKHYWGGARRACVVGAIFIATGALTLYHHFEFDCEIVSFCNGTQIHHSCYPASEPHPIRYGSHMVSEPLPSTKYYMHASTVFNAVLVVFVPILFVCVLNIGLLQTLRTRAAELGVGTEQLTAERMKRTTTRVTVTVIAIALCFSLTQGPSAVMVLIELAIGFKDYSHQLYTMISLTNCLVVMGKTTNFVLFCLSSAHFRGKCLSVIFRKFPMLQQSCLGQRFSETFASHPRGSIRTIRSTRPNTQILLRPEERTILEDPDGEAYEMMIASRCSLSPISKNGS